MMGIIDHPHRKLPIKMGQYKAVFILPYYGLPPNIIISIHSGYNNIRRILLCTYISWLVVCVAITEHDSEIVNTLLATVVDIVLQFVLNNAHVHWAFNYREIVLQNGKE